VDGQWGLSAMGWWRIRKRRAIVPGSSLLLAREAPAEARLPSLFVKKTPAR